MLAVYLPVAGTSTCTLGATTELSILQTTALRRRISRPRTTAPGVAEDSGTGGWGVFERCVGIGGFSSLRDKGM